MAFQKGQSGNPGGRPKEDAEVKALARASGPEAIDKLIELMRGDDRRTALAAAQALLEGLLQRHGGTVLIDAPGANPLAAPLLEELGFAPLSRTLRMYRGAAPTVTLADVYGLACLELG